MLDKHAVHTHTHGLRSRTFYCLSICRYCGVPGKIAFFQSDVAVHSRLQRLNNWCWSRGHKNLVIFTGFRLRAALWPTRPQLLRCVAAVTRPRARDAEHFCEEGMLTLLLHAVNSTCAQRILDRLPERKSVTNNDEGNINERLAKVCHARAPVSTRKQIQYARFKQKFFERCKQLLQTTFLVPRVASTSSMATSAGRVAPSLALPNAMTVPWDKCKTSVSFRVFSCHEVVHGRTQACWT